MLTEQAGSSSASEITQRVFSGVVEVTAEEVEEEVVAAASRGVSGFGFVCGCEVVMTAVEGVAEEEKRIGTKSKRLPEEVVAGVGEGTAVARSCRSSRHSPRSELRTLGRLSA